jgi:predicted metal-dependent HD superfamily phosphohydrolase
MLDELLAIVPCSTAAKEAVITRLEEDHRRYHDIRHVVEMWQWHQKYGDGSIDPMIVASFCLYHDAFYDPKAENNEKLSADLWLEDATAHEELIDTVRDAIVATADHFCWHPNETVRWCLNLDLLRLGTPEEEFIQHGRDIRAEYQHVSNDEWLKCSSRWRCKVMSQATIFGFPQLEKFEVQARRNLANALVQDWKALGYL